MTTGEQPHPHATPADAVGDVGLVSRYGQMAAGIGWTQGALCQAALLDRIASLPSELRLTLSSVGTPTTRPTGPWARFGR